MPLTAILIIVGLFVVFAAWWWSEANRVKRKIR